MLFDTIQANYEKTKRSPEMKSVYKESERNVGKCCSKWIERQCMLI